MGSSTLIRWGGMAAVVAGVLLVVLDLLSLLVFGRTFGSIRPILRER